MIDYDFENWMLNFPEKPYSLIQNIYSYGGPPPISWPTIVKNNKNTISNVSFLNKEIDVKETEIVIQNEKEYEELISKICNLCLVHTPRYEHLKNPLVPQEHDRNHNGMSWFKYFSFRIKKEKEKIQELTVLWSKLSKHISSSSSRKIYMSIRHDPKAFMYLSKYGVDTKSCFRQLACNHHHKYNLGLVRDSFVILFSSKKITENIYDTDRSVFFRCLGFLNKEHDSIFVFNLYTSGYIHKEFIISQIEEFANSAIGKPVDKTTVNKEGIFNNTIYFNKDGILFENLNSCNAHPNIIKSLSDHVFYSLDNTYYAQPCFGRTDWTGRPNVNYRRCNNCTRQITPFDHAFLNNSNETLCELCVEIA